MKIIDLLNLKTRLPVALLLAAAIAVALPPAAQAQRPSLGAMDQKLDQLLQGQREIKDRLNAATCNELRFTGQVWGRDATGVDLRARTNSTLHFIGCVDGASSCAPANFFCTFDPSAETLSFGTNAASTLNDAMRALVDPGNGNGNDMTGGPFACSSPANPDSVSNAPDKPEDATALCRALGYAAGTVVPVNANTCPEAQSAGGTGLDWTSDFVASVGYGREFTCTGFGS